MRSKESGGLNALLVCCRESWSALGEMDPEIAKTQYIDWVQDLFEDFDVHGPKPKRSSSQSNLVAAASREELSLNGSSISTASVQSMPSVDMCVCWLLLCGLRLEYLLIGCS